MLSQIFCLFNWLKRRIVMLHYKIVNVRGQCYQSLHWRHNEHDGVSNHQTHGYLLNRLFRRRSKKTSKLRVTGLCAGNSPGPLTSPHKGPVTRKMFPFDDVIMSRLDVYPQTIYLMPFAHVIRTLRNLQWTSSMPSSRVFVGNVKLLLMQK